MEELYLYNINIIGIIYTLITIFFIVLTIFLISENKKNKKTFMKVIIAIFIALSTVFFTKSLIYYIDVYEIKKGNIEILLASVTTQNENTISCETLDGLCYTFHLNKEVKLKTDRYYKFYVAPISGKVYQIVNVI